MTNPNSPDAQSPTLYDVIIIGSGLAGISAARHLSQAGKACLVLDKGRRIGGRCSTKRKDGFIFNHGAQFFTTKDDSFTALTQQAIKDGHASSWSFGHHSAAYIGAPTMRDFVGYLARDLEVLQDVKITTITKQQGVYELTDEAGTHYRATQCLLTVPAPQACQLIDGLADELLATCQSASYDPCWTVMLALAAPYQGTCLPLRDDGVIGWASYEPDRLIDKGTNAPVYQPAITLQANPDHSRHMLDWPKEAVISEMTSQLERALGASCDVEFSIAHRWLYARVAQPADADLPFISKDGSCALAGDYFGQARLETAYLSGKRAATALLALLS